jgi:hypothetical protein
MSDVKPRRYQVTAPMVVAHAQTADGIRLLNFYRNAFLPPEVPQKKIDLLLRRRMIVEVDEHNRPVQAEAPAPATPPAAAGAAAKPVRTGAKTG